MQPWASRSRDSLAFKRIFLGFKGPTLLNLIEISQELDSNAKDDDECSRTATCFQFHRNVRSFAILITGDEPKNAKVAINNLKQTGINRQQQWEILYTTIEKLRAELEEKRKIVTCLQYRHVLEKLPKKNSTAFTNLRPGINPGGSTGDWQTTWQLADKAELDIVIEEYNISTGAVVGPARCAPASRLLSRLLQHDFDHRISNWRRILPRPARGAPPPPPPVLIITNLSQWTEWPSIEKGKNLYSSLSSNIHNFGKSYDVHEINWSSQEKLLFDWLKPKAFDGEGNVDWDDEWNNSKSLPA